jgi:hypothetical protein
VYVWNQSHDAGHPYLLQLFAPVANWRSDRDELARKKTARKVSAKVIR